MLDLIIVGAGPTGIAAAVEAIQGGLKQVLVLEKGPSHSQMIRTYYKEGKRVDAQYGGQQAICNGLLCLRDGDRESYMALMDHVISSNKITVQYQSEVWKIQAADQGLQVFLSPDNYLESKCVLIAIGRMGRPMQPDYYKDIPASLKQKKKVLFEIGSVEIKNSKVLVVGGGDSAAEYADILSKNNQVTLCYRGSEFKKMNSLNRSIVENLVKEQKIQVLYSSNITQLSEQGSKILVHFQESATATEFDCVVYALGGMNPTDFLKKSGIPLEPSGEAVVDKDFETQIPGLYIAGDLLGKGKGGGSIIAGFNSATAAVRNLLLKYFNKKIEAEFVDLSHLKF